MAGKHTPLYDPDRDGRPAECAPPLDRARRSAREVLDEKAGANIHDHDEMIRAAVGLEMRLRGLLAALDAEEGE